MDHPYEIAAYYFPQYHPDPRNDAWHGPGWTEWELVRRAEPRFPGHRQPRVPLWGYGDEADPAVAAMKIAAAADHGLTTFIYDWYWYGEGPLLHRALEQGFMRAHNNGRLRFALMWANHDWMNLFPVKRSTPTTVLEPGATPPRAFEAATDYIIRTYFAHPSYWTIEGRPYFSIYDLKTLVEGLGGIARTAAALAGFRARVKAAGLPDVHLNAVVWGIHALSGEAATTDPAATLATLGVDSLTSYVWVHHTPLDTFPTTPYADYARRAMEDWERSTRRYALPYYPNVTMGWDSSPRTVQSDVYENLGYPFMPALDGNTPEAFEAILGEAKRFLDRGLTRPPILTINAWNEWAEGSYLEPDTTHGLGYLDAVRRVFGIMGRGVPGNQPDVRAEHVGDRIGTAGDQRY